MKALCRSLLLVSSLLMVTGCVTTPPVMNQVNLNEVDFKNVNTFKRGESCTTFLLGLIPFGSTRIVSAVRDGQISNVKVLEYETRNYLIISQFCMIAYGT